MIGIKYKKEDAFANQARSTLVKEIHKKLNNVKEDKSMEVEYMTLLERDREKYQEGIEEGIEKGIEKGKIEVAKNLLKLGLDVEQIMSATGLSREEIEKLK